MYLKKGENYAELLTAVDPLRTASCAYSTCNKCPSGENTVIALSYLEAISPAILRFVIV
jgi:hypothetical protein